MISLRSIFISKQCTSCRYHLGKTPYERVNRPACGQHDCSAENLKTTTNVGGIRRVHEGAKSNKLPVIQRTCTNETVKCSRKEVCNIGIEK